MRYQHRFFVDAPLDAVVDFHQQSASMGAITPPPIVAQVHDAPARLSEGDDMRFTLWLGPIPIHWHARIEDVDENGFTDRQIAGPFRTWNHRHTFEAQATGGVLVHDTIEIALKRHPIWTLVGAAMVANLPILFAFRAWKTKRLLGRSREQAQASASKANVAES